VASGAPLPVEWVARRFGAAEAGRLDMLQWVREHDCLWELATWFAAALNGHLEVPRWAREHSCDWDEDTRGGAALGGHLEVSKWAGSTARGTIGLGSSPSREGIRSC